MVQEAHGIRKEHMDGHGPHGGETERRLLLSLLITVPIFLAELLGGLWTRSLALLSDSAHVFLDIFALGLSFLALRVARMPADDRHTYGYHRIEVFAALANGITLLAVAAGIFYEAVRRFREPVEIRGPETILIAVFGLLSNILVAWLLHAHQKEDLNVRSAFLHVLGDALSSAGVIVAAAIFWGTGWKAADPTASVLIGILILASSGRVLRASMHILIEGTPSHLSVKEIADAMGSVPGVTDVHDLHVWSICSGHVSLSAHVRAADRTLRDAEAIREEINRRLRDHFGIRHSTIQIETETESCGHGEPGGDPLA